MYFLLIILCIFLTVLVKKKINDENSLYLVIIRFIPVICML